MENKELKFKTNLNCANCVSRIKADLDNIASIQHWSVDTNDPNKILTVKSTGISAKEIIEVINNKGFTAELMQ